MQVRHQTKYGNSDNYFWNCFADVIFHEIEIVIDKYKGNYRDQNHLVTVHFELRLEDVDLFLGAPDLFVHLEHF